MTSAVIADPFPPGPPAHPVIPATDLLPPRRALRLLAVLLLGALLAGGATFLLPDNPYIRHQQARGSYMMHAQWIYERIVFDPTPIDVAIVGASHLEAAASPPLVSQAMSTPGHPVRVVNLSLVRPGRDYTWITVRRLLRYHPEVRMLVLAADGDASFTQPLFKATAEAGDMLHAPRLVNIKYFDNLLYLPYRNISYFAQSRFPALFGVQTTFDRTHYAGPFLDRTLGYVTADGERVNGNRTMPAAKLAAEARFAADASANGALRRLRRLPADYAEPGDRDYVRRIAALARSKGVRIVFVQVPMYGSAQLPIDRGFYEQFGPVISLLPLSRESALYANGSHLNRSGAIRASAAIGRALRRYAPPQLLAPGPTP